MSRAERLADFDKLGRVYYLTTWFDSQKDKFTIHRDTALRALRFQGALLHHELECERHDICPCCERRLEDD